MAISPAKQDFMDVGSRTKTYVWYTPTISVGGDTLTVSGIKKIVTLTVANRGLTTFTYTNTGPAGSVVVTVTVTASCTGGVTPLVIDGQD